MDPFYAEKAAGFGQSRHDPTFSMSRSMRRMDRHELADRGASCISPATEPDGKLRNPPRRRVPVAVGISFSGESTLASNTSSSVNDAGKERSSVAEILAMARAVLTAAVPAPVTASSCE